MELVGDQFSETYMKKLKDFLLSEKKSGKRIFPPGREIFTAFNLVSSESVRAVIIGQDPYHGEKQANGLCFSVNNGIENPPSLNNIFKELKENYNITRLNSDLSDWSNQGVLLLNSILSVRRKFPGSHRHIGWETFTDNVIKIISNEKSNLIFMLWGNYAKNKEKFIHDNNHLILKSGHPSPLSANKGYWFGNKHFLKCNDFLIKQNMRPIKWV